MQITLEEYIKSDWCLENPWHDGYLAENYEDMFEDIYLSSDPEELIKDLQNCIETAKEIKLFEKYYFQIDFDYIKDYLEEGIDVRNLPELIYDYSSNWGMDYWEVEPQGMEIIESFIEDVLEIGCTDEKISQTVKAFNEKQSYYTTGKQVGTIDLSKQLEEYLKDYYEEEYKQFKEMYHKELSSNK